MICTCTYCEENFNRKVSQVTKYKFSYCSRSCYHKDSKNRTKTGQFEKKYLEQVKDDTLLCIGCNEYKEDVNFHKSGHYTFRRGKSYYCKECSKGRKKVDYIAKRDSKLKYLNTLEGHLKSIILHSKNRGREYNIDYEYCLELYNIQNGNCALSNVKMTSIMGKGKILTNTSIDRIDSSKGYIRGNIQLVCSIVNIMKTDLPQEDFFKWCKLIINNKHEEIIC